MTNYNNFIKELGNALNKPLPGSFAHDLLAPEHRKTMLMLQPDITKAVPSSVLILFYPDIYGTPMIIFTKRVEYKGVHSGQMSFPGGKAEETDTDRFHTAYRETEEEIGIPTNKYTTIGALSELYVPPSNFIVFPVVASMTKEPEFLIDKKEVAEIITVPFEFFLKDESVGKYKVVTSDMMTLPVPGFMINGNLIWGATAMILSELILIMKNR